jgi:hypothetical protein
VVSSDPGSVSTPTNAGLPSVNVPVFHDDRRHTLEDLERLGIANEHAHFGAAAGADHDRHRGGESEGARARDDQHRHGIHERVRQPWLRSQGRPYDERGNRGSDDGGDEPRGDGVCQALNRRA